MTNQEIWEFQRQAKAFNDTELGRLFNRFVNLHAKAWQFDERYQGDSRAKRAWNELGPVEKELREKLMGLAGMNDVKKEIVE